MKSMLRTFAILTLVCTSSFAAQTSMMVAISKSTVSPFQVAAAVRNLKMAYQDVTAGIYNCSYRTNVDDYLGEDLFQAPHFYGVALLTVDYADPCGLKQVVARINSDSRYIIYSNPGVSINPSISGRN